MVSRGEWVVLTLSAGATIVLVAVRFSSFRCLMIRLLDGFLVS
jgi:hypothetical protein